MLELPFAGKLDAAFAVVVNCQAFLSLRRLQVNLRISTVTWASSPAQIFGLCFKRLDTF